MMGPRKLSTSRQELERALTDTGDDPILWLEARMTALDQQGSIASTESQVLRSLKRFLEGTGKQPRRKRRVSTKK